MNDGAGDNVAERAGQLEALEALESDLSSLSGLIDDREPQDEGVDLFELLNLWWQEDIHSRLLTWLLDPNGNHGIDDYFLVNFLLHSAGQAAAGGTPTISQERIQNGGWLTATSQREWYTVVDGGGGWLDILVVNQTLKILCAIENKVFSPESGRQLTFYHQALKRDYPDYTRHYVFLSPTGMSPQHPEDQAIWTPVSYHAVLELIERMITEHQGRVHVDVHTLLRQYATTLRRRIVPVPSEVQKRAREIYIANRDGVNLVYQHKPDYYGETVEWLRGAINRQDSFVLGLATSGYLRFGSNDWADFGHLQTGNAFHSMKDLLQFQFYVTNESVQFHLELYPGDDEDVRRLICDAARTEGHPFADVPEEVPPGSVVLYDGGEILSAEDYAKWDDPSVREKVEGWVANFAVNEFVAINDVIVQCLRRRDSH